MFISKVEKYFMYSAKMLKEVSVNPNTAYFMWNAVVQRCGINKTCFNQCLSKSGDNNKTEAQGVAKFARTISGCPCNPSNMWDWRTITWKVWAVCLGEHHSCRNSGPLTLGLSSMVGCGSCGYDDYGDKLRYCCSWAYIILIVFMMSV